MTVKLGVSGHSTPALADFTAFNASIAPRKVDYMLLIQDLDAEPVWYSTYPGWAATLGANLLPTLSPQTHKLSAFTGGAFDTTGLNSGTGLAGLATQAAGYGGPLIIRLAHEFNGNFGYPYGYTQETAAQFVAAWRHIVDVFRANGATNVLWFWCPNIWATPGESFPATIDPTVDDGSGSSWYPGDSYVDLIGLDGYETVENTAQHPPAELFLANYATLVAAIPTKPFAIGEFGCAEDSRLAATGGKAGWYDRFFTMVKRDMPKCTTVIQWERSAGSDDWTISSTGSNTAAAAAFRAGVNAAPFSSVASSTPGLTLAGEMPLGYTPGAPSSKIRTTTLALSVRYATPSPIASSATGTPRITTVTRAARITDVVGVGATG